MKIGEILKNIREQKEMSQQDIGDIINVSGQFISKVEKGFNRLKINQKEKLEKALNIKFSDYEEKQPEIPEELNLTEADWQMVKDVITEHREIFLMVVKELKNSPQKVKGWLLKDL